MRQEATPQTVDEIIAAAIAEAKQLMSQIKGGTGARGLALTITNLEQAQLWLTTVPSS